MAIITTFSGNKGPSSQQSIKNVLTKKLFPSIRLQNAAANQSSCNLFVKSDSEDTGTACHGFRLTNKSNYLKGLLHSCNSRKAVTHFPPNYK